MSNRSRSHGSIVALLIGAVAIGLAHPATAHGQGQVTSDQAKIAISKAEHIIKINQNPDGSWTDFSRPGGMTALNLLALLSAGVPEDDPVVRRGLAALGRVANRDTYVVALKAMVYRYAGPAKYRDQLQAAASWLMRAQLDTGTWDYTLIANTASNYVGDNSNTQFALLGLHEAAKGGVEVSPKYWRRSELHFLKTQNRDGSWAYRYAERRDAVGTGSMTCAGIASLFICGNQLDVAAYANDPFSPDRPCVEYRPHDAIASGLAWMADRFSVQAHPNGSPQWRLYYLYAMERVGMISGLRFFGAHDWYREGAEFLVNSQQRDGSWGTWADTAFGLLFLAKGNKPVLINKLQWSADAAWNPVHHEIEHLTQFLDEARNEADKPFTDQPLGWQVVTLAAPLADLLDAPILYLTGYDLPQLSPDDRAKLAEFVDQGGTIVAAATCSRPAFAAGFRRLVAQTWPDYALERLDGDHPIFTSFYDLAGNAWGLEGVQVGCRTSVIFSPTDLPCLWEQADAKRPQTQTAFRLGANICAYATGLERLKEKLDRARVAERDPGDRTPGQIVRGAVQIAVLAHSNSPSENMTDPGAMPKFHAFLRDQAKIDVIAALKIIEPTDPELLNHPIMFMTGHNGFEYSEAQLSAIRTWLDRGGFLYADACCGRDAANYDLPGDRKPTNDFGTSFRRMCRQLYPEAALTELGADHPIRGGGTTRGCFPLAQVTYRPQLQAKLAADPAHAHDLHIEGLEVDGRLRIVYSRYAVTCGLEDHKCFGCRGLVSADAYRLSTNVILYAMSH